MTVSGPLADPEVPAFWQALGLPGLIDIHTHFMPKNVLDKVWAYFDAAEPLVGRSWPITYRDDEGQRIATLRVLGVLRFTAMVYPHKPDMAEWLNSWAADFAGRVPDCLRTATFFPEPSAARYVTTAIEQGARVFKAHLQVGGYDPRDPMLEAVWGLLAEARLPVVVHAGSGPTPGAFTGPELFGEVLARHPRLVAVIAHMGSPEYESFHQLALRYEAVHLDTTMAFTDFMESAAPYPRRMLPKLRDLGERIVFGSDFPNIPHTYAHQLRALARLDLGDDWLRRVCHGNAAKLFGS